MYDLRRAVHQMHLIRSKWRSSVDLKPAAAAGASAVRNVPDGPVVLQRVNRPDLENLRHRENSLKLWIFEAKRLPAPKKRYYCEIYLDHTLYARTTGKEKTQDAEPFWGEEFEFNNLQDIALVTIRLYREPQDRKLRLGGRRTLLGELQLASPDIRAPTERWFALQQQPQPQPSSETAAGPAPPSLRVRAHFLSVDVLPLRCYRGLRELATHQALAIAAALEPRLQLRAKEDLAARLVAVAHAVGRAEPLLADLAMTELSGLTAGREAAMIFRGNSVATKAVEHFLKLTGSAYLKAVLAEPLEALLKQPLPCEVEPQRVPSPDQLAANQRNLIALAEQFWSRIRAAVELIPPEVARVFALLRQRLAEAGRPELGDTLVSASLFLRLICPAILGPSLFGLCSELPGPRASRALTLVAKAVQNLANAATFGSKEPHMQFMNRFLEQRGPEMRLFLRAASRPGPRSPAAAPGVVVDLGYELAQLHALLSACLATLERPEPILISVASELAAVDRRLRDSATATGGAQRPGSEPDDDPWVYSNASECPGSPQTAVSAAVLQEDWKRVLEEAQSFTTGSSGYQSFTAAAAATPAAVEPQKPAQFYNPTYQKAAEAPVALPFSAAGREEYIEEEDEIEGAAARSDDLLSQSSSSDLTSSEASFDRFGQPPPPPVVARAAAAVGSRSSRSCLPLDAPQDGREKSRSLGPGAVAPGGDSPARVRMGVRACQHQQPPPQPPPQPPIQPTAPASRTPADYETELLKLQLELTDTRRRLQATEARLRSNETEKARLMVQFQMHHQRLRYQQQQQQQQEPAADSSQQQQQMLEIMQRLRSLECSLNKH